MATRKKSAAKRARTASQKNAAMKKVLVCSACKSPHASILNIHGVPRYVCQRCGHVSQVQVKQNRAEALALVKKRRSHTVQSHRMQQHRRHQSFSYFVTNYTLRMWFKVVSTFLLGLGLVLLPSVEYAAGILFVFIGIIGLYAGLKWM